MGLRPIIVSVAAIWLSGCAISTQLGPIFGGGEEAATGAITPRDRRFSNNMTDEDWTRAMTAVETALSPTGAGKAAQWENPASGLKGTVSPVAAAYAADSETCHAFVASLTEGADTHWYQGRACRTADAPWKVVETAQWTPPGHS
jgi:surface antigen